MSHIIVNVLLAAPYGKDIGGIARWTEHILAYYQWHQSDVNIEILSTARNDVGKLRQNIFKRIIKGVEAYIEILSEQSTLMKKKQYQVFHMTSSASLGLFKDYLMLKNARKHGVKTITHFRFGRIPDLASKKNWEWKMLKRVVELSNKVVVLDELSYLSLQEAGYHHIIKLPNPISPRVIEMIDSNGIKERNERTILFVGHCYLDKGVRELVLACKDIENVRLIMMGAITNEVKKILDDISENAMWLEIKGDSKYEDVIKAMASCSVFVLPTYTEGFPNVILESMACGCPIVTTDVGAIPEMLDIQNSNNYGICVKPKDVEGLKDAICKMLNDKVYAKSCGENARRRVIEQYSMPRIWSQLVEMWNKV